MVVNRCYELQTTTSTVSGDKWPENNPPGKTYRDLLEEERIVAGTEALQHGEVAGRRHVRLEGSSGLGS